MTANTATAAPNTAVSPASESASSGAESSAAPLPFLDRTAFAPGRKREVRATALPSGRGQVYLRKLTPLEIDEITDRHLSYDDEGSVQFTNAGRRAEWAARALANPDGSPLEPEWLALADELNRGGLDGPDLDHLQSEAMALAGYKKKEKGGKSALTVAKNG